LGAPAAAEARRERPRREGASVAAAGSSAAGAAGSVAGAGDSDVAGVAAAVPLRPFVRGAVVEAPPRASRIAATRSLLRIRPVPLSPISPASAWSSARRMVLSEPPAVRPAVASSCSVTRFLPSEIGPIGPGESDVDGAGEVSTQPWPQHAVWDRRGVPLLGDGHPRGVGHDG